MLKKIISVFMAMSVGVCSANAQIKCDKNILFTTNALKIDPAIAEIYEDNYVPEDFESSCALESVQSKQVTDEISNRIQSSVNDLKISDKIKVEINYQSQILVFSFLSMFYLAKNGYKKALVKELSFFTERLLEINSLLEKENDLTQEEKVQFLKKVFNFMSDLNQENFKNISLDERQRVVQFLNEFSREILKENYIAEYNKLISKDIEKQGAITHFSFTMLFALTIFFKSIGLISNVDFLDQMIFDNGPWIGVSTLLALFFSSMFIGYKSSAFMYKKWISKIKKDPKRIHEAAKQSCLIYLDEGH